MLIDEIAGELRLAGALAIRFHQRHAPRFDHVARPHGPHALARLGLEAHVVRIEVEDAGDAVADGVHKVGELRLLGVDYAVEVHDLVARLSHLEGGDGEHLGRVAVVVGGVGVGEGAADVGERRCAQQGVGHGVEQHVAVAVADQLPIVRHVDATDPQRPARLRAMTILTESDPQLARNLVSYSR